MDPSGYSTGGPRGILDSKTVAPATLSSADAAQFCGGYYNPSMLCMARGAPNADNSCQCPGTADSMPYKSSSSVVSGSSPNDNFNNKSASSRVHVNVVGTYLTDQRKPPSWHYEN